MSEALTHTTDTAMLNRLLKRVQGGDTTALADLRGHLNEHPERWHDLGNIAMQARRSWIDLAAVNNEVTAEALWRHTSAMTVELSGRSPSLLDSLLIGRVVTCWIQVQYWDWLADQSNERTLAQREYLQRSQGRAQRRYLSAIRSLATVRRLQLPPAVQVNIGGQQVNMLNTGTAPV